MDARTADPDPSPADTAADDTPIRRRFGSARGQITVPDDFDAPLDFCADPTSRARFTAKQGQYLAFIHYYTKILGVPPAEADFARYFKVTPPAVHLMVLTLESRGLIERTPGKARSIRLRLSRAEIPDLE